ncbi:MAG TPA: hypothetical protein VGA32_01600 [Anaerolineales bacterium]
MALRTGGSLNRDRLEAWLEEALVPVEPTTGFVHRLRARLVDYRGQGGLTPWMLVVILGAMVVFLIAALSASARVLLTLLGVLGVVQRQRQLRKKAGPSPV